MAQLCGATHVLVCMDFCNLISRHPSVNLDSLVSHNALHFCQRPQQQPRLYYSMAGIAVSILKFLSLRGPMPHQAEITQEQVLCVRPSGRDSCL